MNFSGVIIGLLTFFIIGLFHPIVIKSEYHMGKKIWPAFLALGVLSCVISLIVEHHVLSAVLAVLGFTSFWTIKELFEQEERVEKGWHPMNPKRACHYHHHRTRKVEESELNEMELDVEAEE